jgi:hypothetical protein
MLSKSVTAGLALMLAESIGDKQKFPVFHKTSAIKHPQFPTFPPPTASNPQKLKQPP